MTISTEKQRVRVVRLLVPEMLLSYLWIERCTWSTVITKWKIIKEYEDVYISIGHE